MAILPGREVRLPWKTLVNGFPGLFGIRFEEEPKFYVIFREGEKQIRKYRPIALVETELRGPYNDVMNLGFRRLFAYLQGQNKESEIIRMTTPVFFSRGPKLSLNTVAEEKENFWNMAFILPSNYTNGILPEPVHPLIKLQKVPALTVATLRYSGINTEEKIALKTRQLLDWAQGLKNYKIISGPRCAQYDAPFVIPAFRRNEIQVTLEEFVPRKKTSGVTH